MIGLDTNVLIRYLVQDDPVQSPKATAILERHLSEETPGFVSVVVTVEMFSVLEGYYDFAPSEIAAALERLLAATRRGRASCGLRSDADVRSKSAAHSRLRASVML